MKLPRVGVYQGSIMEIDKHLKKGSERTPTDVDKLLLARDLVNAREMWNIAVTAWRKARAAQAREADPGPFTPKSNDAKIDAAWGLICYITSRVQCPNDVSRWYKKAADPSISPYDVFDKYIGAHLKIYEITD